MDTQIFETDTQLHIKTLATLRRRMKVASAELGVPMRWSIEAALIHFLDRMEQPTHDLEEYREALLSAAPSLRRVAARTSRQDPDA